MKNVDSEKVEEAVNFIRSVTDFIPDISITLGSGMNSLSKLLTSKTIIPYSDIPNFPVSTVPSHDGFLIFGELKGKNVVIVSGRFHYYEGYEMSDVTFYIHVLKSLGVKTSILTSASGGLNPHYKEGEIVVLTDHINLFSSHPLRGMNDESNGPRFPDMMKAYPEHLINSCINCAHDLGINIKKGVYLGWQGPTLETPAEYKMARLLGADLVGMSTVPEVIINKYCEIETLALSIVSNKCFPSSELTETTLEEVIETVNSNALRLQRIITSFLGNYSFS